MNEIISASSNVQVGTVGRLSPDNEDLGLSSSGLKASGGDPFTEILSEKTTKANTQAEKNNNKSGSEDLSLELNGQGTHRRKANSAKPSETAPLQLSPIQVFPVQLADVHSRSTAASGDESPNVLHGNFTTHLAGQQRHDHMTEPQTPPVRDTTKSVETSSDNIDLSHEVNDASVAIRSGVLSSHVEKANPAVRPQRVEEGSSGSSPKEGNRVTDNLLPTLETGKVGHDVSQKPSASQSEVRLSTQSVGPSQSRNELPVVQPPVGIETRLKVPETQLNQDLSISQSRGQITKASALSDSGKAQIRKAQAAGANVQNEGQLSASALSVSQTLLSKPDLSPFLSRVLNSPSSYSTIEIHSLAQAISHPLSGGDGNYTVVLSMHPSNLGHLQAVMSLQHNELQVSILPQTQIGHSALTSAIEALKVELAQNGLNVNVTLQDPGTPSRENFSQPKGRPNRTLSSSSRTTAVMPQPIPVSLATGQIHIVL